MFGTGAMTRTDGRGGPVLDGVETAVAAARVSVSSATRSAFDRGLAQTSPPGFSSLGQSQELFRQRLTLFANPLRPVDAVARRV